MKNIFARFKTSSAISKVAVLYALLIVIYEAVRIASYISLFVQECQANGDKFSSYLGYVFTNVIDSYILVPAALVLITLLAVKTFEASKEQKAPNHESEDTTIKFEQLSDEIKKIAEDSVNTMKEYAQAENARIKEEMKILDAKVKEISEKPEEEKKTPRKKNNKRKRSNSKTSESKENSPPPEKRERE